MPDITNHHNNPTRYPICGKCKTVWQQKGNLTGHCAKCHQTFGSLKLFDRHQHLDANGDVTCTPGSDIRLGSAQTPLENVDGVWQGPRMPQEVANRLFGATRQHRTAIRPTSDR